MIKYKQGEDLLNKTMTFFSHNNFCFLQNIYLPFKISSKQIKWLLCVVEIQFCVSQVCGHKCFWKVVYWQLYQEVVRT